MRAGPPAWFLTIEAAQIAGVAPWELNQQPLNWQNRILIAAGAKAEAQEWHQQQAGQRAASHDRIARVRQGRGRFQR